MKAIAKEFVYVNGTNYEPGESFEIEEINDEIKDKIEVEKPKKVVIEKKEETKKSK